MFTPVSAWMIAISSWPLPAQWALKGCLLLTVGTLVALAVGAARASADVRHRAWAWTLGGGLLAPLLAVALPGWSPAWAELPARSAAAPAALVAQATVEAAPAALPEPVRAESLTAFSGGTSPLPEANATVALTPARLNWPALLACVWLAGAAIALAPVAAGLLSLTRLGGRARPASSPRLLSALEGAQRDLGLRRRVRLWTSSERSMPMTWGWLRPVVLLPADADQWNGQRLRAVLCHELAHVERRDPLVRLMAQLTRAAYWFYPLAHLALRRLERDQEFACDDRALSVGQRPAEYAEHLLAVATARPTLRWAPSAALAMAQPGRLEQRLQALLDPRRSRRPAGGVQRRLACAVAAVACVAVATLQAQAGADESPAAAPEAKESVDFDQLRARVLDRYISRPDERKLLGGAIQGMLQALDDPYSAYLPPDAWSDLQGHVQGNLAGIGAALRAEAGSKVLIDRLLPGSAAAGAGLAAGDQIVAIDGKPVDAVDLGGVARAIRGAVGSAVTLRVTRAGQPEREVRVVRAAIALARDSVRGYARAEDGSWLYWLDPEAKIAFVSIREFTSGLAAELRTTLERLQSEGMKGLVVDLRTCPGGVADEALDVARLFVKRDTVLATFRTRGEETKVFQADGDGAFVGLPLVVLINAHTASAAELLAGSLGEQAGAVLVGTRTLGKGSVQELAELGEGLGGVRLTVGSYRLPSGREVQRTPEATSWGVDPTAGNYVPTPPALAEAVQKSISNGRPAPGTPAELAADASDPQLAAALTALTGRLRNGQFAAAGSPLPDAGTWSAQQRQEAEGRRQQVIAQLKALTVELKQLEAALP